MATTPPPQQQQRQQQQQQQQQKQSAFRSVLPHEPLPREEKGYLLVQGAFYPRLAAHSDDKQVQSNNNDNKKGSPSKKGINTTISTSTTTATTASDNDFWTQEALREALFRAFHSLATTVPPVIPCAILDVQILEDAPPYTKARLTLASPRHALDVVHYTRIHPVTCDRLFSGLFEHYATLDNQQQQQSSSSSSPSSSLLVFSSKVLQWTRLTMQQPLPPTVSWTRSSPPKFRRLLPRPGEDLQALQDERSTTRFVFVTNLLSPTTGAEYDDCPTQDGDDGNIYIDNNDPDVGATAPTWSENWIAVDAIRSVMEDYDTTGAGIEVFVNSKKLMQYCHIGFRSAQDAQTAIARLQEQQVTWEWTDANHNPHQATSGKLFLDYAAVTDRSMKRAQLRDAGENVPRGEPTRSECTSSTSHVQVPGLCLIPDFVNAEEEEILLALLKGPQAPWAPSQRTPTEGGIVKRRVQHYGYVFDYQTADVLRDKTVDATADCPPMPAWPKQQQQQQQDASLEHAMGIIVQEGRGWPVLAGVIERVRRHRFEVDGKTLCFPNLNQMTLNHYEPGEGIGSHIDTKSAFGDGLLSLSLQSGTVMEFRLPSSHPVQRKLLYLPPRSLVAMTGPARYEWEHMIVTRRTDTHNSVVIPRGVRVSLTLRTALELDGRPLPLLESCDFPLQWGQGSNTKGTGHQRSDDESITTPECERRHVHQVYDAIARQWHHTRGRRGVLWPGATQFLERLPVGSMVADVGCGDGKYFPAIWDAGSFVVGTDISRPLLQTAFPDDSDIPEGNLPESRRISTDKRHLRERPAVAVADCMNLPLRNHAFDAAICIAVLHHLSTHARRVQCLRELARVVRVGGLINVQAWALDQEEGSRRKFATEDVFVPFNAQPKYLDLQSTNAKSGQDSTTQTVLENRSTAQVYSEAFNAQYDDHKGLVVFQRYCHLYREGELEELVTHVPNLELVEGGFESGNYFIILRVVAEVH